MKKISQRTKNLIVTVYKKSKAQLLPAHSISSEWNALSTEMKEHLLHSSYMMKTKQKHLKTYFRFGRDSEEM